MEIQDQRASRAAALSAARRRLTRLKVAALTSSLFAFAGLSAGMALKTTSKVVASSSVSAALVTVTATPATVAPAAVAASAVPTAVPAPTAAPTAAAVKQTTAPIVSAQS